MTPGPKRPRARAACAGFSIVEGLVALVLTGLILSGLSILVSQWMPRWNHGFHKAQRTDLYAVALDRIAADLTEARYVTGSARDNNLFFSGEAEAMTFVRPTLDPGAKPGLEVVRIATVADKTGVRIVRRQARFSPLPPGVLAAQDLAFTSTGVLLRANARVAFSYADPEGRWRGQWDDPVTLPARVRIELRDLATGAPLAPPTTAVIRAEAPARCASARSLRLCNRFEQAAPEGSQPFGGRPQR